MDARGRIGDGAGIACPPIRQVHDACRWPSTAARIQSRQAPSSLASSSSEGESAINFRSIQPRSMAEGVHQHGAGPGLGGIERSMHGQPPRPIAVADRDTPSTVSCTEGSAASRHMRRTPITSRSRSRGSEHMLKSISSGAAGSRDVEPDLAGRVRAVDPQHDEAHALPDGMPLRLVARDQIHVAGRTILEAGRPPQAREHLPPQASWQARVAFEVAAEIDAGMLHQVLADARPSATPPMPSAASSRAGRRPTQQQRRRLQGAGRDDDFARAQRARRYLGGRDATARAPSNTSRSTCASAMMVRFGRRLTSAVR